VGGGWASSDTPVVDLTPSSHDLLSTPEPLAARGATEEFLNRRLPLSPMLIDVSG